MPSERRYVPYRPDATEEAILENLAKRYGLSMSRVIGLALREKAEREFVPASPAAATADRAVTAAGTEWALHDERLSDVAVLLSADALARMWDSPEEDEVWRGL
jgi:hypothetical protein